MEKMISVINDNLNSVVNGIKDHKEQAEELLATIKTEMDKKVDIAQEYKNNVEDAKNKIARAEAEIKDLEKDLEDLNQKFDGKDFREILNAGNKEINSKIIEKRKAISVQGKRILDVTDKAHDLKEDIVDLKNRKIATEEDLVKTNTLLNYYETNINNMIDFTTYHVDELEGYSVPNYGDEDVEDVDINKIEDGSIFEEIADISQSEPDAKLVDKALNNKEEFDEEFADILSEDNKIDSDSMAETLESIISTGKDIISSGKYVGMMDYLDEDNTVEPTETVIDEDVPEDVEITFDEDQGSSTIPEDQGSSNVPEENGSSNISEDTDESVEIEDIEENGDSEINFDDFLISFDDVNDKLNLEETEEEATEEPEAEEVEETTTEETEEASDEETMDKYFSDEFDVPGFEDEFEDKYEDSFPDTPVEEDEVEEKTEIIPIEEDLGSSDKEKIVNLLLKTPTNEEEINTYVTNFKDIDVDRLKREVENDKDRELADILVGVMPLQEDVIQEVLGLNDDQTKTLKKAAGRKYITINAFPDLVKHNFDTIKNLGVKDPIGIFINHPNRFTMNPSNFDDILDKYDEEDLIRCLDKNGAVIDKL